jgi:hypothetical protein
VVPNYVDGILTVPDSTPAITDPENFQWEGEHEIVEDTIYSITTPANTLNLSGGDADWEAMNAVIYAVDIDFFQGRTSIQFGPFKHLQAAEYFEMVMAFRYRQVFDNPSLRNNGQAGGGGGADIGKDSPKENTTHQIPAQSVHTVYGPVVDDDVVVLQHDANTNGGQILVQSVVSSTGAADPAQPQVKLSNSDLGTLDDVGRIAKWRSFQYTDCDGNDMQFWIAATVPEDYADATYCIGGGGGMNYKGTYNSSTTYAVGDVVRVQSGSSQGVWVCVIANPGSGHQPTFPEPATTGGTNYWEMFTFGIQETSVCAGGSKTVYINATAPD